MQVSSKTDIQNMGDSYICDYTWKLLELNSFMEKKIWDEWAIMILRSNGHP